MLKRKIDKAAWDALSDELKALYKVSGEDYILDAEVDEDTDALKRAKLRVSEENSELKTKLTTLEQALKELREATDADDLNSARKKGDLAKLEAVFVRERDELKASHGVALEKKDKALTKLLVDDQAEKLAKELNPDAWEVLLPHVKSRLAVDLAGDVPVAKVLTAAGEPSTLNVKELKKEFLESPVFKAIVKPVDSSGGGASRQDGSGASEKAEDYPTEASRTELYHSDQAKFHRIFPQ